VDNSFDAHLEAAYEALFDYTVEEPDDFEDVEEVQHEILRGVREQWPERT